MADASVLTLARRRVRRRPSLARSRSRFGTLLLLPFLIVNLAVVGLPSLATAFLSFTDWTGVGAVQWIGAGNYRRLLGDAEFRSALTHTLVWTAILLAVPTAMALCGAAILARLHRGRLVLRLLFFLPYTVATVVTSSVWQDLLDPEHGIGPQLARLGIGWPGDAALLGNGETALAAVASINVWALWGFQLVIFLSAMQGVDEQLYEAARIDGANVVRQFWHVTLPGILPTFVFVVLIGVVWSLLAFDYVWIATHGGPAGATELVGTLVYREAFERYEVGYAATMGLSLTIISGLVTVGFVVLKRRGWTV